MKRNKKTAPALVTYLELNKKYGRGYQGHLIMNGVIDSVIDDEPFTLDEAFSGVVFAIEQINKETGYNYDPYKLIHITDEAIKSNKDVDFTTARINRDIKRGRGELATQVKQDFISDSKGDLLMSGRGTMLFVYRAWISDKMPKAREALRNYCKYLALRGYSDSVTGILTEMDCMDKERCEDWIKATYDKYVVNDMDIFNDVLAEIMKNGGK